MEGTTAMESLLDPLFQELADGVGIAADGGEILYLNPAAQELLGVAGLAWKGMSLCEVLCGHLVGADGRDYAANCPLRRAGDRSSGVTFQGRYGPHVTYDWRDFRIHKQEKWTQLRVRCLRMPAHAVAPAQSQRHLILIQDASAEYELEQHREDWRSMVAHDLRSPLTNIYGTLRLLEDLPEGQTLTDGERKLIEIGSKSCRRMLELLNLYLDIAKLDAALMPVELKPIGLLEVVSLCVEQQQPLSSEKKVGISVDVPADLKVSADAELLFRVIDNLLNNAVKFSPDGGTVAVAARRDGAAASVCVKDQGPGIPPDDIPLLFDRFHQARARRAGKTQGTGLGLTFCREAMRVMHGEIGVSSSPGKGAEFILRLAAAREGP